jgi:radical SAM protein with 4Fe4S-binding SPASM domain
MIHYLNVLSKLTYKKILNFLLVEISFILSVLLRKPVVWGLPYTVSIEPTIVCSLKCPDCHTGAGLLTRTNQMIDDVLYRSIIDEINCTTLYLILYFQGEPLMNKDIFDMIRYASDNKIFTVTSTNGQHLDRGNARKIIGSGLDRLIISVDGTDQKTYAQYRKGGSLKKITEGTQYIKELKIKSGASKPEVIFQFLVFRHNENQINEVKMFGKKHGADKVWIKMAQVTDMDHGRNIIPENPKYTRYKINDEGALTIKGKLKNRCKRLWRTTVVTTDGIVVPCCFDKNAAYVMGDLNENDLTRIWKNQKYDDFRRVILKERKSIDICNNCTEGIRVYL